MDNVVKKKKIFNKSLLLKIYISFVFASLSSFPLYGDLSNYTILLIWIISFVIWFALASIASIFCPKLLTYIRDKSVKLDSFVDKYVGGIKLFFVLWLIIVVLWIVPYLALFPGTFGNDGPLQIYMWEGYIEMTDHHPFFHTLVMGVIYDIGVTLFGSSNAGIALFTAIQGVLVASSIAFFLYTIRKYGASCIYVLLSLAWVVFNPFIQAQTFSCTKDIFFGVFMLYFCTLLYCYLKKEKTSIGILIALGITGLLMCLVRHQGIYIFAVVLIFVVFAPRNSNIKKVRVCVVLMCIIVAAESFNFVVHNYLGFKSGDPREMLCVPMQQMAYVCNLKLDGQSVDVSDEQLRIIDSFIPEEGIRAYKDNNADFVKSTFDTEAFRSNLPENIKTYVQLGVQNKGRYLYAFKQLINGYLDSQSREYSGLMFAYTYQSQYELTVYRDSKIEGYYNYLVDSTVGLGYKNVPLMSVLCDIGLSIWLMVIIVGLAVYRKDYKLWLLVLPMLLFLISLFLGPAVLIRYIFPMLILTPLMGYLIVNK